MTKPISDVMDRWVERLLGKTDDPNFSHPRISTSEDVLKGPWGSRLVSVTRNKKGDPVRLLLNGDEVRSGGWGGTDYNRMARSALASVDLPKVTIPHSALEAAGVDLNSIDIIDVTEDRHETINHEMFEQPENTRWVTVDVYGQVDLNDEEIEALLDSIHFRAMHDWQWRKDQVKKNPDSYYKKNVEENPNPPERPSREVLHPSQLRHWRPIGIRMELHWGNGRSFPEIDVQAMPDGSVRYRWTQYKHWLGESLIRAKIPKKHWRACKVCGGTGSKFFPHYQKSRRDDRTWCIKCRGAGAFEYTLSRTAYFLSGFDHNESRPSYFFCELPKGVHPESIEEAYECLKPETVKLAEQLGRPVMRQGDIFAVSVPSVDKRSLRKQGARFEKMGQLLGTNHCATEVAYLKKMTLVRGILWHKPQWRDPDHQRVNLGPGWWVVTKNTVPITK